MAELFIPRPNGDVLTRNPGLGKVFYVDHIAGNASNEGTDPQFPLKTIAAAILLCTAEKGDWVFVVDSDFWTASDETFPIALNKGRMHLIGVTHGGQAGLGQEIRSETNAIFSCCATENQKFIELAGFNMWAPADKACIEALDSYWGYLHLHHLKFDQAQDGIKVEDPNSDLNFTVIEDCLFERIIGRDGIRLEPSSGSGAMSRSIIRNNIFRKCIGHGIYINPPAGGEISAIINNFFQIVPETATAGAAITFGVKGNCNCLVDGNHAAEGRGGCTANPYRDLSTAEGAATQNAWGRNYNGVDATAPATT